MFGNVISKNQHAFIPRRQLFDRVLVVNELIDIASRHRKNHMLLKIDFEKPYDNVSWNSSRYMLKRMSFGSKWINWM